MQAMPRTSLQCLPFFFSCQQIPCTLQPKSRGMTTGHRDVDPEFYTNKAVFFNIVTEIWNRFHARADYRIIPDAKTKSWRSATTTTTYPLTCSIRWLREWAGDLITTLHSSMSFIRRRAWNNWQWRGWRPDSV